MFSSVCVCVRAFAPVHFMEHTAAAFRCPLSVGLHTFSEHDIMDQTFRIYQTAPPHAPRVNKVHGHEHTRGGRTHVEICEGNAIAAEKDGGPRE